ncbi:MAG: hypothetical protein ACD_46C00544G0004 [uncultured bacterium]|nr:MAG: hypothetical protein ACD_46C00544G0004 [uncultured bacterium]
MYKVTKQYGRGSEIFAQSFSKLADATSFMQLAVEADAAMKVNVIYRLYEFDEVIKEIDSSKMELAARENSQSGQGKTSGATFKPTPFEMSPRPRSTPPKWLHDEEDKNKDEDKK